MRSLTNYHIHKKQELSAQIANALERIADLDLNSEELVPKGTTLDGDLAKQTKRLSKWLYLSDGYALSERTELEDAVDSYLIAAFKSERLSANDIALWKWLEFSAPV